MIQKIMTDVLRGKQKEDYFIVIRFMDVHPYQKVIVEKRLRVLLIELGR